MPDSDAQEIKRNFEFKTETSERVVAMIEFQNRVWVATEHRIYRSTDDGHMELVLFNPIAFE